MSISIKLQKTEVVGKNQRRPSFKSEQKITDDNDNYDDESL